ncbi:MAG TPA: hypothetical protein VIO64_17800 [Pseudobacteroides sp.]|uniref:hypothetical protein n=1 Tax=Pseudobacteroides sp. TaxID=1968840 RepID=UPI002F932D20
MENNNNFRLCDHCKEEVSYYARRCPYCGSLLNNQAQRAYVMPQETIRPDAVDTANNTNNDINTNNNIIDNFTNNEDTNNDNTNNSDDANTENINGGNINNFIGNNEPVNREAEASSYKDYKSYQQQPVDNRMDYGYRFGNYGDMDAYDIKPLSNKTKVFLTALSSFLPWVGQLTGIIAAIVYMNSEDDEDRRSFGRALLVSSLVVFLITSFLILFTISAFSNVQ